MEMRQDLAGCLSSGGLIPVKRRGCRATVKVSEGRSQNQIERSLDEDFSNDMLNTIFLYSAVFVEKCGGCLSYQQTFRSLSSATLGFAYCPKP